MNGTQWDLIVYNNQSSFDSNFGACLNDELNLGVLTGSGNAPKREIGCKYFPKSIENSITK
jgi:hypothetical protein